MTFDLCGGGQARRRGPSQGAGRRDIYGCAAREKGALCNPGPTTTETLTLLIGYNFLLISVWRDPGTKPSTAEVYLGKPFRALGETAKDGVWETEWRRKV
jgi:hypothetical protein